MDAQELRRRVGADGPRCVDALKEACSIPSVSAEGLGLEEMAGWLEERLRGLGAKVEALEAPGAPPALLGEIPGPPKGPTLLVYDHYDVQPVDPIALWESPPFEPTERSGRIYARGVADNKGDLVARLCAVEAYRNAFGELPFTVKFLVEGEEETGSRRFEAICDAYRDRLQADDCVWEGGWFDPDGRPVVYYGCKGLLYLDFYVRKLTGDQHSSLAVYAPSAAWRLVQALASLRGADARIAVDGFYDACVELSSEETELVDDFPFNEEAHRSLLGVEEFAGRLTGKDLRRSIFQAPTANIAGIVSGYTTPGAAKTVLPAEARAKMDFRLVPDQQAPDIAQRIRAHLDSRGFTDVGFEVLTSEEPSRSPRDTALGNAVERSTAQYFEEPAVILPWMWATGPMHPIAAGLGIPICSPPGVDRPDSNVHAPNENILVTDFLDIIGFTALYLHEYSAARG